MSTASTLLQQLRPTYLVTANATTLTLTFFECEKKSCFSILILKIWNGDVFIVTAAVMELEVWAGDWGVPSVDRNCLIVMVSMLQSRPRLQ